MKIKVHPDYSDEKLAISLIPEHFERLGRVIYQGRNTLREVDYDDQMWVVKRFKPLAFFRQIVYSLASSKAKRAFVYAGMLRQRGIRTPKEIAYIETTRFGMVRECYFVSEKSNARILFHDLVEPENYNKTLADSVADFFVTLHKKGILHGDPNMNNIMYDCHDGHFEFSLIDINRTKFKDILSRKQCVKNLMRLTHRRDLLTQILIRYAQGRKWEASELVDEVLQRLSRFERQKTWRHAIKRKLRLMK